VFAHEFTHEAVVLCGNATETVMRAKQRQSGIEVIQAVH
jgi:hypothetical protein